MRLCEADEVPESRFNRWRRTFAARRACAFQHAPLTSPRKGSLPAPARSSLGPGGDGGEEASPGSQGGRRPRPAALERWGRPRRGTRSAASKRREGRQAANGAPGSGSATRRARKAAQQRTPPVREPPIEFSEFSPIEFSGQCCKSPPARLPAPAVGPAHALVLVRPAVGPLRASAFFCSQLRNLCRALPNMYQARTAPTNSTRARHPSQHNRAAGACASSGCARRSTHLFAS